MVRMGETDEEIRQAMIDLRSAGVDMLTIGQYLRPTDGHLPVQRYVRPETFALYKNMPQGSVSSIQRAAL